MLDVRHPGRATGLLNAALNDVYGTTILARGQRFVKCPYPDAAILIIAFNDGNAYYLRVDAVFMVIQMIIASNNLYNGLGHGPITTASAPYPGSIDRLL